MAWTDTDTWRDANGSGPYGPNVDETGKCLVLAEYDTGFGWLVALSYDAFRDSGFEDHANGNLMRAMLYRVMGGASCGTNSQVYLPLVVR